MDGRADPKVVGRGETGGELAASARWLKSVRKAGAAADVVLVLEAVLVAAVVLNFRAKSSSTPCGEYAGGEYGGGADDGDIVRGGTVGIGFEGGGDSGGGDATMYFGDGGPISESSDRIRLTLSFFDFPSPRGFSVDSSVSF
jgi:hypothetical protein